MYTLVMDSHPALTPTKTRQEPADYVFWLAKQIIHNARPAQRDDTRQKAKRVTSKTATGGWF